MFDFEKIPQEERAELIGLYHSGKWSQIVRICEQYEVSQHCCCNLQGLVNYLTDAIKKWAAERLRIWLVSEIETKLQLQKNAPEIAVWGIVLDLPSDIVAHMEEMKVVYRASNYIWFDYLYKGKTVTVPINETDSISDKALLQDAYSGDFRRNE